MALACREYYPDVEIVGKYDTLMPPDMQAQVGMRLNVPLQQARHQAAVQEAQARLSQQRAEYANRRDQVAFEVQAAMVRVSEAQKVARLYTARILPAAEQNLKSARANYVAGKVDFSAAGGCRAADQHRAGAVFSGHRRVPSPGGRVGAGRGRTAAGARRVAISAYGRADNVAGGSSLFCLAPQMAYN